MHAAADADIDAAASDLSMTRQTKPATPSVRGLKQSFLQPTLAPLPGWSASPMTIRATRTQFVWTPILGWVLLSCAATAVHAQVDTPSPAKQTLDQQTPQVDLPDASASTGGLVERGATSSASASARSRCFRRSTSIWDMTTTCSRRPRRPSARRSPSSRPSLELRSEWLNHSIRLLATGGFGYYANAPTQNFQNYLIQADGKLDIRNDVYATGLIAFRRNTEALGTPNVSFAQAPTVVDSVPDRAVALSEVQSGLLPALCIGDAILVLRLQHDHRRSDCRRRAAIAPSTKRGSRSVTRSTTACRFSLRPASTSATTSTRSTRPASSAIRPAGISASAQA